MERPIIFSTEMVKAILGGRKTQTRRVIKPQPIHVYLSYSGRYHFDGAMAKDQLQVGDRLWVKETWREQICKGSGMIEYLADNTAFKDLFRWKPSIHMFRKDSRITLGITEVRVERVQEITVGDAIDEGISGGISILYTARDEYRKLWDSLNAKRGYGWDTNPWVWVINIKCDKI